MNDRPASINTPIEPNCEITIEPSTAGREAHYLVGQLEEYHSSTITFEVNGKLITCPRYVEVNGVLEPPTYEIKEHDAIITRSFYTVAQLAEFMDVELDMDADILVNNRVEDMQALVYENFSVDWKVISYRSTPQDVYPDAPAKKSPQPAAKEEQPKERIEGPVGIKMLPQNDLESEQTFSEMPAELPPLPELTDMSQAPESAEKAVIPPESPAEKTEQTANTAVPPVNAEVLLDVVKDTLAGTPAEAAYTGPASAASPVREDVPFYAAQEQEQQPAEEPAEPSCQVIVNGETITMKQKKEYIFVDIFDYILFDLSQSRGRMLVTQVNGEDAQYTQLLQPGDKIDIYWKDN